MAILPAFSGPSGREPLGSRRLCALGVVCALLAGCGSGGAEAERGPKPITVEAVSVQPGLLRDVATFSGQLDAEHSVVLKSETDGVIETILFEEGQRVEQGAVLFQLRSEEQVARLREAQANLALAREVHKRTDELLSRDAVSLAQKDKVAAELSVARARVDLARLAVARTRIEAPFDGAVGVRMVSPGDRISDETPLVQIDTVDRLQVIFAISELGILFARPGATIEIHVAPYPDDVFPGEVFFVSPSLDPATRRVIVKGWVPNADGRLRAGLFANVDLEIATRENAIQLPESAVIFDRNGTYVWRLDEEKVAARVPVELGLRKNGRVEVTLGLQPGDIVVTAGTHKVDEGRRVEIAGPGESATGQAQAVEKGEAGAGT